MCGKTWARLGGTAYVVLWAVRVHCSATNCSFKAARPTFFSSLFSLITSAQFFLSYTSPQVIRSTGTRNQYTADNSLSFQARLISTSHTRPYAQHKKPHTSTMKFSAVVLFAAGAYAAADWNAIARAQPVSQISESTLIQHAFLSLFSLPP